MLDQTLAVPPRLLDGGGAVEILLQGVARRFHALWLRDNAQDARTRSPGNGQRLITLLELPAETRIAHAAWVDGQLSLRFEPEGRQAVFDPSWLEAHIYDKPPTAAAGWTDPHVVRWDAGLAARTPTEAFGAVRHDPAARRRWLCAMRSHGFARLTGAPTTPGAVTEVVALFGYVRETNYGRVFDVRTEADPSNLAYTNLGLQPHTDNPYRDPAPGLQLLLCLENTAEGGRSVVVDGFEAVARLKRLWPRSFDLLARYCARFAYAGAEGVRLQSKRPVIELGPDGELLGVRFNNRSAAPVVDVPYDEMADYYAAHRRLAELIEDPALQVSFQLVPGELFMVDNTRVLHGRTPITGPGARWLQGCYADRDGLYSTLAVLEAG